MHQKIKCRGPGIPPPPPSLSFKRPSPPCYISLPIWSAQPIHPPSSIVDIVFPARSLHPTDRATRASHLWPTSQRCPVAPVEAPPQRLCSVPPCAYVCKT